MIDAPRKMPWVKVRLTEPVGMVCLRCGAESPPCGKMKRDEFLATAAEFTRAHEGCPEPPCGDKLPEHGVLVEVVRDRSGAKYPAVVQSFAEPVGSFGRMLVVIAPEADPNPFLILGHPPVAGLHPGMNGSLSWVNHGGPFDGWWRFTPDQSKEGS
jgi:hypothetical protein